jgi:drug/metabolite transporter (DMT)-like permease
MSPTTAAPSSPREVRAALLLLLLATLSVGISGTMVRLSETGPVATAFWRMALATPVMWVLWRHQARKGDAQRPTRAQDYALLVASGVLFGAEMGVWHISLMMTSVTNATLLSNASPIVVALGGWLLLRERLTTTFLLGMAVALAGCAVLVGQSVSIAMENVLGDGLAVFAAVLFGLYILCIAKLRQRLSTALIMTWTCAWGAAVLLPATLLMGERFWPESAEGWAAVATIALACQVAGQTLLTSALAHLPAAFSSVAFLLVPVNAAWIAWAALGEPVRPLQVLGAAIIFAGVILARRGSR